MTQISHLSRLLSSLAALLLAGGALAQSATPAPASPAASHGAGAVAAREGLQVPGYYHQRIGALQVTALFDGVVTLPRAQILGLTPAQIDALLQGRYVPEGPQGLQTAVNAYLVQTGGRRVLVDAGTADCFGAGLGQVQANLRATGVEPGQIDDVLLTHAHPDHLCGVLGLDGAPAYPNATLWLDDSELKYWEGHESEARTPKALNFVIGLTRRALAPYRQAGRVRSFRPGDALPAGIQALASPGHTPGHTSCLIDGGPATRATHGAQKLLVWGDVVHYHVLQFAQPAASFEPDVDRQAAIASRRALLADAARHGWWVAGAHLPFPGLGHVRAAGKGYAWVPVEFSPLARP